MDRCSVFLSHTLEYVSTYAHRTATGHINLTQRNLNATASPATFPKLTPPNWFHDKHPSVPKSSTADGQLRRG